MFEENEERVKGPLRGWGGVIVGRRMRVEGDFSEASMRSEEARPWRRFGGENGWSTEEDSSLLRVGKAADRRYRRDADEDGVGI